MFKSKWKLLLVLTAFLMLIFDAQTAIEGAGNGISLCLYTVIPSLFPFLFLSSLLVNEVTGAESAMLRKICAHLGMPGGSEGFLAVGFLGGYPTGASCIAGSYRSGQISKQQAERLLSFCSNAGPAFIFGIAGSLLPFAAVWFLWGIHIISALLTALLIPQSDLTPVRTSHTGPYTAAQALIHTLKVVANVCGWVILFRIIITFSERRFLWLFPKVIQIVFSGFLELSNGCCSLENIASLPLRFVLFSLFLAFGGVCVTMQTATAAAPLSLRYYIIGKILQSIFSIFLCVIVLPFLFGIDAQGIISSCITTSVFLLIYLLIRHYTKKTVAFQETMIYNGQNG